MLSSPTDPHPCFVEPARRRGGLARPGVAFCRGKLMRFDHHAIEIVRPWPPQGWRKVIGRPGWSHFRPEIHPLQAYVGSRRKRDPMPSEADEPEEIPSEQNQMLIVFPPPWDRAARERDAVRQFFEAIPSWAMALARRYRVRLFHVLSMLARCPGADDLARSTPSLAWMLASNWVFHRPAVKRPLRAARALLKRRQRFIAEWLGFPGEEWVIRALRRVPSRVCDVSTMLYLRDAFRCPEAAPLLRHAPKLNRSAIRIISDARLRPHIAPGFLEDVARDRLSLLHWGAAYTLADLIQMYAAARPGAPLPRMESTRQLQEMHDELVAHVNHEGTFLRERDLVFPPPPIPETKDIVALRSVEALVDEGRKQSHCIGSYGRSVASGSLYCYALLHPERGTICVRRTGVDGVWSLHDARGRANRRLRPETLRFIERWLRGEDEEEVGS